MGTFWNANERDCAAHVQSVRPAPRLTDTYGFPTELVTLYRNDFVEIMEMLDKRLNDKGKMWRHVFKVSGLRTSAVARSSLTCISQALTLLDYCLHAGSENVVIYFRDNAYLVKTLREFQFVDEDGKDQGANVRQKAKDITNLLQDDARLRQGRRDRKNMNKRMMGGEQEDDDENARRRSRSSPPAASTSRRPRNNDEELQKALEASKRSHAQEAQKALVTAEWVHMRSDTNLNTERP